MSNYVCTNRRRSIGWYQAQFIIVCALVFGAIIIMLLPSVKMPGSSYSGKLPSLTEEEVLISSNMKTCVVKLASEIGDRNYSRPLALKEAADYIGGRFEQLGYKSNRQYFKADEQLFENVEAELLGKELPDEIIVLGAHYDSCDCPGANDNGSGVAAMLELARILKSQPLKRTVRFVAFSNEEHFFGSDGMGSFFYAKRSKDLDENVIAMLSLETIGYYSDKKGSQKFPFGLKYFYPDRGDFIAFVSNTKSKELLKKTVKLFRDNTRFPSQGLAAPSWIRGVSWSDHYHFWKRGYPALMVTDTAPFRYPYYHKQGDTPDKIDFDKTARVVAGLSKVVIDLAN